MKHTLHSKAPTRIDLAGGTIDLWPLYLMLENAKTINLGIDLFAETKLTFEENSSQPGVEFQSHDLRTKSFYEWENFKEAEKERSTILAAKILAFQKRKEADVFHSKSRITVETSAKSPDGAGLGGSSTLAISTMMALDGLVRKLQKKPEADDSEKEIMIHAVKDIESSVIAVPAGVQDYYGAMFGGLHRYEWLSGETGIKSWMTGTREKMSEHLLLFYSGKSRNSGINNWVLFKNFIDQSSKVKERFQEIAQITHALESTLDQNRFSDASKLIYEEWKIRNTLASGISTPEIEEAFSKALNLGATGVNICGAGGGGCFFVALPDEDFERKKKIISTLESLGEMRHLPFTSVEGGAFLKTHES